MILVIRHRPKQTHQFLDGEVFEEGAVIDGVADDEFFLLLHADEAVVDRVGDGEAGDEGFSGLADAVDAAEG